VVRDYLTSSPGGLDLVLDILVDDLSSAESRLKEPLMDIIRELMTEE